MTCDIKWHLAVGMAKHLLNMNQLPSAFSHKLPILDDLDDQTTTSSLANSATLDDVAEPLDQAFPNYVLSDTLSDFYSRVIILYLTGT